MSLCLNLLLVGAVVVLHVLPRFLHAQRLDLVHILPQGHADHFHIGTPLDFSATSSLRSPMSRIGILGEQVHPILEVLTCCGCVGLHLVETVDAFPSSQEIVDM